MDEAIIKELHLKKFVPIGSKLHGGCISKARAYHTDKYGDVFIKFNNDPKVLYKDGLVKIFHGCYSCTSKETTRKLWPILYYYIIG